MDGGVPTGTDTSAAASAAWFQDVVRLPDLDDRVWDARLIGAGDEGEGEDGKQREERAGMGLLAVALAHNSVEVGLVCPQDKRIRSSGCCAGK